MFLEKIRFLAPIVAIHIFSPVWADTIGIVGGSEGGAAYAAIIDDNNTIVPLSPLPASGFISSVDISHTLYGAIGGYSMGPVPYGAVIHPDLTVVPFAPLPASGLLSSVSINSSGFCLIAGNDGSDMYAAHATSSGSVTQLGIPMVLGNIAATDINDSGNGVLGGRDYIGANFAYAALIGSGGLVQGIDLSSLIAMGDGGNIVAVSINESGSAVIGGLSQPLMVDHAIAAFVSPSLAVTPIALPVSITAPSQVYTISINESGNALIGGFYGGGPVGFAVYATPGGTVVDYPTVAADFVYVNGVSLNKTDVGIIAGEGPGFTPAAAFSYPDGTLTSIPLGLMSGALYSADIADTGVALIGGEDGSMHYVALVAPDTTVTVLVNLAASDYINSMSLVNGEIFFSALSGVFSPASVGPYSGALNSVLSTSNALNAHIIAHHKHLSSWDEFDRTGDVASLITDAAFGEKIEAGDGLAQARQVQKNTQPLVPERKRSKQGGYTTYLIPFYDRIHQSSDGAIPSVSNDIGGGLLALEYTTMNNMVFGGGLSYSFNYAHYSESLGHSKINQEMAVLYSSFNVDDFFLNLTLWGGLYQLNNTRHSPPLPITSTLSSNGWVLSPHLELSYSFSNQEKWFFAAPFGMVDWVNNWQKEATEKGSAGLNLVLDDSYNSLLRSEVGFRFYEVLNYDWGRLLLTEKASYINRTPFNVGPATTYFIGGGASPFSVATGSTRTENLGGAEINLSFLPWNFAYPYVSIDAQGEFGSTFQSYFVGFEIGKRF